MIPRTIITKAIPDEIIYLAVLHNTHCVDAFGQHGCVPTTTLPVVVMSVLLVT